jgi:hypothetical protein
MFGCFLPIYRPDRAKPAEWKVEYEVPEAGEDDEAKLRDWFAGQIAAGMAAYSGASGTSYGPGDIAGRAYDVADAMLAERKRRDGK